MRIPTIALLALAACGGAVAAASVASADPERSESGNPATIAADFDGDGAPDTFSMAFNPKRDTIEVFVRLRGREPYRTEFPRRALPCSVVAFAADCPMPPGRLDRQRLDTARRSDFRGMFGIASADLVDNGKAETVVVPNGETDPLWFYWNPTKQRIEWTSL